MKRRIWFDVITLHDAKLLKQWWENHTIHHYEIDRSQTNSRYFALIRLEKENGL